MYPSFNTNSITVNTIPLDFLVIHLLFLGKLVILGYPHGLILFLSKSITSDLTDMLNLNKTNPFHPCLKLDLTRTLSNALYLVILAIFWSGFLFFLQLCWILMLMAFVHQRKQIILSPSHFTFKISPTLYFFHYIS